MKIQYGDMISFVISTASIVLAVIPILIIPDNEENTVTSLMQINRASDIYHNYEANDADKLWAFNKLHLNPDKTQTYISQLKIDDAKEYLARAMLHYNKGDIKDALIDYNNAIHNDKNIIDYDAWYKMKVFSIEKNITDNNGSITNSIEDINCVKDKTKKSHIISEGTCSHAQLQQINNNIKRLIESGNTSDFYNTENTVLSLQKPIETFVTDLNYFIIGSIITGPIIFTITVKHIFREK